MTITEINSLARQLMDANGLAGVPIKWDRSKRRMGACMKSRNCVGVVAVEYITLSSVVLPVISDEEVIDTIKHEIAHALAPFGDNHGLHWMGHAINLGCKPQPCCSEKFDARQIAQMGWKFILECPSCKAAYGKNKLRIGRYSCPRCKSPIVKI